MRRVGRADLGALVDDDLDVESIEQLEDAIERFPGTVVLVSHDRELLRKLVTRVWELRDAKIRVFDGDFAEFEEQRDREEQDVDQRVFELPQEAKPKRSPRSLRKSIGTMLRQQSSCFCRCQTLSGLEH